jgi:ribosome-associated protein
VDRDGVRVSATIVIPRGELHLAYVRSSGPGGQNVNKVASKAVLRFNLRDSPSLPDDARRRALAKLAHRVTAGGELVVTSGAYRDQPRNREAAIARLRDLLADAVRVPRKRRATRPSAGAVERRLVEKRRRAERKRERTRAD